MPQDTGGRHSVVGHVEDLGMDTELQGIQVTQVDDTLGGGTVEFGKLEGEKSNKFECQPRKTTLPFLFNGLWIDKHHSGGYIIHQNDYCSSLQKNKPQSTLR